MLGNNFVAARPGRDGRLGRITACKDATRGSGREQRREWSERHFVRMDDESGKQLALEVEANFVALRLKKQLDIYRSNWETIVGCQFIAGVIALVAILAFVNGKFDAGVVNCCGRG
jgi:hypothetical protein